jgi:DNA mismatch endonuclease, patch repair protein
MSRVVMPNGVTMAQIGPSKGTRGEVMVAEFLEKSGFEVKRNHALVRRRDSGKCNVDVYLPMLRIAIFVDGRFWHDPSYAAGKWRPHHKVMWALKAAKNEERDKRVTLGLEESGVTVIRIWDTDLKGKKRSAETLDNLLTDVLNAQDELWRHISHQ